MASQPSESRVLIVMTGGTICMKESPEGLVPARGFLQLAMAPRPSFNDGSVQEDLPVMIDAKNKIQSPSLRTPPSNYNKHIRYTLYEFPVLLDSSSISAEGWTSIAETIQNNYELYDGFVVLHGTDSLSYTCSALSFMFDNLGKPIIITGAQSSIFSLVSDATSNLLGSLILAGTFNIPEVLLFFNNTLFRGNRTMKVSASDYNAFASPNMPPLATINSSSTKIDWHLIRRSTTIAPLSLQKNLDTAYVACLRIFPGIKPEMVDAVLNIPNLKGLILETFGAGNAPDAPPTPTRPSTPNTPTLPQTQPPKSLFSVIRSAVQRGTIIVNISSCPSGTVSPTYAPGQSLGKAGVVFGHDLTTEAALTKLSYLLALPNMNYDKICKAMCTNLRGEITELAVPHFKHPDTFIPPTLQTEQSVFAALGYAIANNDFAAVESLLESSLPKAENSNEDVVVKVGNLDLLGASDYCGNTALHLAALMGSLEMVEALLKRGANVHARNGAGNTPLGLAVREGRGEQVALLKKAGGLLAAGEKV